MRAGRSLFEVVSGVPVVTAPKEIDIATAPALRSALLTAVVQGHGTLVLDMTMTRFCDSSGLHTLLAAHKRAQDEGGSLLLISPARAVLRVLEVTGLNRLLPSFTSLDQALAHPAGKPGSRWRPDRRTTWRSPGASPPPAVWPERAGQTTSGRM